MARHQTKIRLFVDTPLSDGDEITLDREQSHYLGTVMRQKLGAMLLVFNGKDGEWLASIKDIAKRAVSLSVTKQTREQENEPDLWFAFAPIKKARLDFMAQKATELGVAHMIPIITRRTIVDRVNTERMHANAVEAAEQCERLNIPTIGETTGLEALLAAWPGDRMLMFCDEDLSGETAHSALKKAADESRKWGILIGPEGGFDDTERALIKKHPNCIPVSLGPRVLRADTAAMAAITLWQSALGDW